MKPAASTSTRIEELLANGPICDRTHQNYTEFQISTWYVLSIVPNMLLNLKNVNIVLTQRKELVSQWKTMLLAIEKFLRSCCEFTEQSLILRDTCRIYDNIANNNNYNIDAVNAFIDWF